MGQDDVPGGTVPAQTTPSAAGSRGAALLTDVLSGDLSGQEEVVRQRVAKAAAQKAVPHPTVEERRRRGRVTRAEVPREQLAAWERPADRADPVAMLAGQETSRVQELVPVRHQRMASGVFAFFRGAALLMAADLAVTPRTGLTVQLCGDAHLANFGLFGAPDRSLVFDLNDFDETNPGPFEWDVKRLATSFVLAARDNGLPAKAGLAAAEAAAGSYRQAMAGFATKGELEIWYDRVDVDGLIDTMRQLPSGKGRLKAKQEAKAEAKLRSAAAKARSRDAWSAIEKITEVVDGHRRFRDQPPLLTRLDLTADVAAMINALFREYRGTLQENRQELLKRYQIIDIGHKVVGVGSVGLLAFVLLLRGRDEDDLMVLQVKQAQSSVLEPYTRRSAFTKHGHRVVTGQRLMQAASDSFLGWIDGPGGRSFYVRQLRDMKWSPETTSLNAERLRRYALICGLTLARAHARSGDAVAIAAYLGSGKAFVKAMRTYAVSYADQCERDYAAFTAAIGDGRLDAHEDVGGAEEVLAVQQVAGPPGNDKDPGH
ncbi:MAG TPA: DUF2252 domain-containing protein [Actinomycetes bacterium]|nr:DUF2252 domain-containing protein [Actinomycetes bacterium]